MLFPERVSVKLRLERLRSATGKTWDAVAADLGIKRAMLFHVLSGRRSFSDKSLQRLRDQEVAAGLKSQAHALIEKKYEGADLVSALLQTASGGSSGVTVACIDAGKKEVLLEYRRGTPPPGYPTKVTVKAPQNTDIWRMIGQKSVTEDASKFLVASVSGLEMQPDLLEIITPTCYILILETALDLTFGLNWRSRLNART